jgi:putative SOS response-associated peptidase YedK
MRAFETTMIRLAVEVLERAARVAKEGPQRSADVRLALRVLAIYMRRDVLERFWEQVGDDAGVPWSHALMMHGWIVQALTEEGWEVTPGTLPCEGWAMCNRYRMTAAQAEVAARYGVTAPCPEDLTVPAPELFPDRLAWTVRELAGRQFEPMRWGWPRTLPGKRPGTTVRTQVTNVRNLESPFWRSALSTPGQRCLVPVTAFSEYGAGPVGKKPLWWFDVPSQPIFSFAGIFRPIGGQYHFAFLTCEPNAVVGPIHPKAMPVILQPEDEERWLAGELDGLVEPFPSQLMKAECAQAPDGADKQDEAQTDG